MNTIKPICLSVFSALVLAGCGAQKLPNYKSLTEITAPVNIKKNKALTETQLKHWNQYDIVKDTVPGMSVDRAYAELLKNRKSKKVIVGIVDSGVDIEHEDLKSVIWTNPKEIPGNGIDDDKNGYVDDIHGWNFLGDIVKEHLEYERIIKDKSLVDEATYQEAKKQYDKKIADAEGEKSYFTKMITDVTNADKTIQKQLGKGVYTVDELKTVESKDTLVQKSKAIVERMFSYGMPVVDFKNEVQKQIDAKDELLKEQDKFDVDYRKVLGDNPNDITATNYGNNNVTGPDKEEALHGTHVAGIVAQLRNNNIGGDGIADNVAILTVRAVPDGDEYDKDIALAIRYAVDNGAKVINGSFGKAFSPHKNWVFDAIKYAAKKDVLIVHAAGNDAKNIDYYDNFPNDSEDKKTEISDNLITVGALNFEYDKNIAARFSNIGKINVDVFAPGVKIYASIPDNKYRFLQGTSMAAPNVAGVAALIRSYYPKLTASQVKHILMDSGVAINMDVVVGGNPKDMRAFSELSKTGKIVNAYNAILMANKMAKK
ncbi:S8 family peptidase [Flavobacterium undicola]|uniref:S8 family peptidase n=1 Tax=Flavobacterium undicola TaxID=1932779 RepID=UPI001378CFC5|nr:S8 family peptidase [Flavobacterium undicola]MBA0883382.1 S8 family serine peptidase [Flavobacterium undicola]